MVEKEQFEKTANKSLKDFKVENNIQPQEQQAPQMVNPQEQQAPQMQPPQMQPPQPQYPQQAPQPNQYPQQAPQPNQYPQQMQQPQTHNIPNIDMNKIVIDEEDYDATVYRLKDDDVLEQEVGDKTLRLSKGFYTIKIADKDFETFKKKLENQQFSYGKTDYAKTKPFIETRLSLEFEEVDYKSSLPKIFWFPSPDFQTWKPSFKIIETQEQYENQFTSTTSKLHYKFHKTFDKVMKEKLNFKGRLQFNAFLKELIGKKVQLQEVKVDNNGKITYRLDVFKFDENHYIVDGKNIAKE